ncbi:hypothetical protein SAMN06295900_102391 [Trinickia caryophylli]|uniref:Uncharacterized protein n=1 Tax=Trinickia caryophylli TaxID=28094 RepID=A0A1X7D4L8_TRICW|nr:hypothetical protein C0Z17_07850 [Trinickia caryophylli]SMF08863.1 hypothetical protein SAMN06295900_102391 [Trinickia caryophylli]
MRNGARFGELGGIFAHTGVNPWRQKRKTDDLSDMRAVSIPAGYPYWGREDRLALGFGSFCGGSDSPPGFRCP